MRRKTTLNLTKSADDVGLSLYDCLMAFTVRPSREKNDCAQGIYIRNPLLECSNLQLLLGEAPIQLVGSHQIRM